MMLMKNLNRFLLASGTIVLLIACSDDSSPARESTNVAPPPAADQPSAPPVIEMAPVESPVEAVVEQTVAAAPAQSNGAAVAATSDAPAPNEAEVAPQQHEIQGVVTQWRPLVLFVQPGDQIVFKQMAGHDTATIDGMFPEGAQAWQSKLGEEGYSVTLDIPGVYIYKCTPHVGLGMIGAIVVGDSTPHNLPALEAHPQNKGMIGRAIRKLKQALDAKSGS